jgi:hypothetical protein
MKACSSSGVEFSVPTSPISPPMEIVTPLGLERAHVARQLDGRRVVRALLRVVVGLREVDERGRVHVDVVEAGVDRLDGELLDGVTSVTGSTAHFLAFTWKWSPWMNTGPAEALAQRGGDGHAHVLGRALLGVGDLRARDLEDEGAGVEPVGRAEDRAHGVVRRRAHVDRPAR